ncbi:hypothetical protein CANCADRAFT_138709 [Tortispora caseinolytica NRRL Y-17796]|uniref:THO complex subunit 1 n=1 Tax=Tortispora caseinolytica NRRL Y-17796 TaxID=767744 RepID=A0A1E4TC62_9ASCO|nr:hypothetical protein CANCADRAFT_138709 [Tortispora caseinolytica NRRL Y-17796]
MTVADDIAAAAKVLEDNLGRNEPFSIGEYTDSADRDDVFVSAVRRLVLEYSAGAADDFEGSVGKMKALMDLVLLYRASADDISVHIHVHDFFELVFQLNTIDWCKSFWSYMDERKTDICNDLQGNKWPGSTLIRVCNALLRRTSKNRDASFTATVLIYLASAFPLSEKSALNTAGKFNTDNKTFYDQSAADKNYQLFWRLQEHLNNVPSIVENRDSLATFKVDIGKVLDMFQSMPVLQTGTESTSRYIDMSGSDMYMPKWLTSPALFEIELQDVEFRRAFYIQLAIVLDSLLQLGPERRVNLQSRRGFYGVELSDTETNMFQNLLRRVLGDRDGNVPPMPGLTTEYAQHIYELLDDDSHWTIWKMAGCPPFSFDCAILDASAVAEVDTALKALCVLKKPYMAQLGTPALSKIWRTRTGLENIKISETPSAKPDPVAYFERWDTAIKGDGFNEWANDEEKESSRNDAELNAWLALRAARLSGTIENYDLSNIDKLTYIDEPAETVEPEHGFEVALGPRHTVV